MSDKNFDAFKPLNEAEENQIHGGHRQRPANACAPIANEIAIWEQRIRELEASGQVATPGMLATLDQLRTQYKACLANQQPC